MGRPLDHLPAERPATAFGRRRLRRSAARAFAASLAILAVSALVITASDDALLPARATTGDLFGTDSVELVDGAGRALARFEGLAGGRAVEQCLAVSDLHGAPAELTVEGDARGQLGEMVSVLVERTTGPSSTECSASVGAVRLFEGTLDELDAAGPLPGGRLDEQAGVAWFRFRFEVADDVDPDLATGTALFEWRARPAVPSADGP